MAEQVIIEFVGDTSKLEPAIDTLAKTGQVTDKDAATFKNLGVQSSATFKLISSLAKSTIKSLSDVTNSAIKLSDTFTDNVAAGIQDGLKDAGVSIDEVDQALAKAGITAQGFKDTTDKVTQSHISLRQELINTRLELARLKLAGETNTDEFRNLTERAGELQSALKHVSEEVALTGSDTRGLDKLLELSTGVAGGFTLFQGAAALAGGQSEELQQTLIKVNGAMAILQGLQEIQSIANKESFQSLENLIGAEKIQTLQTNLETAAESKNIVVKYLAIAAQKALNFVLSLNPVGLALVAVAALALAYEVFSTKAKKAAAVQRELNDALFAAGTALDATLADIDRDTQRQIALAKLRGKSTTDLMLIEGNAGNLRLQRIHEELVATAKQLNTIKIVNDATGKAYQDLFDKRVSLQEKFDNEQAALQAKADELTKKRIDDAVKSEQAFVDAKVLIAQKGSIDELNAQINAAKKAAETTKKLNPDLTAGDLAKLAADTNRQVLELQNQIQIKLLENEKFLMQAKLATIKEGSIAELQEQKIISDQELKIELAQLGISKERKKELIAENAKTQQEFDRQIRDRQLQGDLDTANASVAIAKVGSAAELSAKLDALRIQNELDVNAKGITNEKKLELDAAYLKATAELTRQADAQTQTEAINTKQAQINAQLANLQRASTSENNKELLQLKKDSIEEQAQLDIVSAHATINNEQLLAATIKAIRSKATADKIAIGEQAAKSEIDFETDVANSLIELEIKKQQRIIELSGSNVFARQRATKQIFQLQKEEIDNEVQANQDKYDLQLITDEEYLKTKLALEQKYEQLGTDQASQAQNDRNALRDAGLKILSDGVAAAFDIQNTARQQDLDNAIAALQTQHDAEVNVKNLTEGQKAEIDKKFKAKEDALKLKAFIADKQAKKQQAIISGALAIVNALATAPTIIAGIALAAVVAADTAFEIAKINAAQPPAFKKGTRNAPRGYKWVGEEGPELTWSKGGEVIYTHKQSMTIAEAWRGGSLAHADDILRGNIATPNQEVLSNISVNNAGHFEINWDAIGEAIAEHLPAPNLVQNNIDANGMTTFIISNGDRMKQLNQRYSIK